jgi:hypothetical protein
MYNYGGYNNVCNIGEELRAPERTLPRSIVPDRDRRRLYVVMSTVILGMVPWREVQQTGRSRRCSSRDLHRPTWPDRGDGHDVADPVRDRLVALRDDLRLLRIPFAAARGSQFFRVGRSTHQALSARLAADDRRGDAAVLLLLARTAGRG